MTDDSPPRVSVVMMTSVGSAIADRIACETCRSGARAHDVFRRVRHLRTGSRVKPAVRVHVLMMTSVVRLRTGSRETCRSTAKETSIGSEFGNNSNWFRRLSCFLPSHTARPRLLQCSFSPAGARCPLSADRGKKLPVWLRV